MMNIVRFVAYTFRGYPKSKHRRGFMKKHAMTFVAGFAGEVRHHADTARVVLKFTSIETLLYRFHLNTLLRGRYSTLRANAKNVSSFTFFVASLQNDVNNVTRLAQTLVVMTRHLCGAVHKTPLVHTSAGA